MSHLEDILRWIFGPSERRALRRAARWGVGTFLITYALFQPVYGPYPAALTAAIFGWLAFVPVLIVGLTDHRRVG
jgi:hypothetical protein